MSQRTEQEIREDIGNSGSFLAIPELLDEYRDVILHSVVAKLGGATFWFDPRDRTEAMSSVLAMVAPCCVCGSADVVYRNYREQPFCAPCANGEQR